MNDFINLGPIEKRDPGAHIADPRGVVREHSNGLTKREYFAAMAMQGMASEYLGLQSGDEELAARSVRYADALIKELAK